MPPQNSNSKHSYSDTRDGIQPGDLVHIRGCIECYRLWECLGITHGTARERSWVFKTMQELCAASQ